MALKRISGLWLKDGKSGKFMSGKVQDAVPAGAKLLVFRNQNKRNDHDPDYTLHVADDEDDQRDTPRSAERRPVGAAHRDQRKALSEFEAERREAAAVGDSAPF